MCLCLVEDLSLFTSFVMSFISRHCFRAGFNRAFLLLVGLLHFFLITYWTSDSRVFEKKWRLKSKRSKSTKLWSLIVLYLNWSFLAVLCNRMGLWLSNYHYFLLNKYSDVFFMSVVKLVVEEKHLKTRLIPANFVKKFLGVVCSQSDYPVHLEFLLAVFVILISIW